MKHKEIENRLKRAVDEAPIDLLETLQSTPVVKMAVHDEMTEQNIPRKYRGNHILRSILAAAMFLIVIGSSWIWSQMEITTIYLDINPSVSLSLNRMDKVRKVATYNEKGSDLIEGLALIGLKNEEALKLIYERTPTDQRAILLSVKGGDGNIDRERMAKSLETLRSLQGEGNQRLLLSHFVSPTESVEEAAKALKISPGKLEMIKKMILAGSSKKTENLAKLSITELIQAAYEDGIEISDLVNVEGVTDSYKPNPIAEPKLETESEEEPRPILVPAAESPGVDPLTPQEPRTQVPYTEPQQTEPSGYDDDNDYDDDEENNDDGDDEDDEDDEENDD